MRNKINELRAQIKEGSAGDELLASFIQTKQEEVREHMMFARQCDEWALNIFKEFSRGIEKSRRRALRKLKKSLKKEGFVEMDFSGWTGHVRDLWGEGELVDLTKSSWKRCIPSFIRMAQNDKSYRVLHERRTRKAQRRDHLLAAYTQLRKNSPSNTWWNFPSPEEMLQLPASLALIEAPSEKVYEQEEFTQSINALSGEFNRWYEEKKEKLISSLPSISSATSLPVDNQLKLAVAVFSCPGCANESDAPVLEQVGAVMFGWDEANRHFPCSHLHAYGGQIAFDPIASNIVLSLLEFLGLPETTTATELDQLNQRFLCGRCVLSSHSRIYGLCAMTWRECIFHVIDSRREGPSHNVVGWHLLTPQVSDYVIRRGPDHLNPMDKAWYCTHCSVHVSDPVLRHSVIDHLRTEHNIKRPVCPVDIIYSPLETRKPPKQLFIPIVPNGLFCSLCTARNKVFLDRPAMEVHVRNKHNVEPNENEHWEIVQPILRSSEGVLSYQITTSGPGEEPETADALNELLGVLHDDKVSL